MKPETTNITPGAAATAADGADLARNLAQYDTHWSSRFRKKWNYSSQGKVRRFRHLMRRRGLLRQTGLRVFDQGFGLGLMLFCFDRSSRLAGLELSRSAVEAAKAEAETLGFAEADLRQFEPGCPLPPEWHGCFDVVISSHVLEHIADAEGVLRTLVPLLRPGGTACLAVPINEVPGEDLNHFYFFTPASLASLASRAGLVPEESVECDRLWDLLCPLAYALQRRTTAGLRLASTVVNALTGILPLPALDLLDALLRPLGFKNRQVFLVCRRPAGEQAAS